MVHLKVLELCCMKLMVQFYTTGPNDSAIYNWYNILLVIYYIVQTGVLSIVPIGVWRIGGNWPYILLYILILLWFWDP